MTTDRIKRLQQENIRSDNKKERSGLAFQRVSDGDHHLLLSINFIMSPRKLMSIHKYTLWYIIIVEANPSNDPPALTGGFPFLVIPQEKYACMSRQRYL